MRESVLTKQGFDWVFKGPLVDVDIPENGAVPLPECEGVFAEALALNTPIFGALLALQKSAKPGRGPLDSVSVAEYIDGWKRHGARVGHYEKGHIVWHG